MKVVAINTSPEKEWGAISLLLDPYLEGMREAGADVDLYYSRDLLIFPCCGNLNCTIRTPGQCMAFDDMRWLREKIGRADVLVLASPMYFNGITGPADVTDPMRRLRERLVPGGALGGDAPYEHALHTIREAVSLRKVVVVSGCGFWEIDEFYPVLTHLKAFCYNSFPELAGCINEPRGAKLRGELPAGASTEEIAGVARTAGREVAQDRQDQARPALPAAACDGGKEPAPLLKPAAAWHRREWKGEILLDYGIR